MRIAVAGGTGLTGRHTVESVRRLGHDAVVIARSTGADVMTGEGLDDALQGVDAVIDVTNLHAGDADAMRSLYTTSTRNLLGAEVRTGVRHHVLLSIVSVDRIASSAHYAGKRAQEQVLAGGEIPFTIQRATQYHEFADMMLEWSRRGDSATIPPLLLQPVAVADVADVLAEIAMGQPQGMAPDLAGPELEDLVDMVRRIVTARGEAVRLTPSWRGGIFGPDAAGEHFLPGPEARLAPTTFAQWLLGHSNPPAS